MAAALRSEPRLRDLTRSQARQQEARAQLDADVDTVYLKLYDEAGSKVAGALDELFAASLKRETHHRRIPTV